MTRREREVAGLAASGESNKEIAARLFLSARTVENHLQRIYANACSNKTKKWVVDADIRV